MAPSSSSGTSRSTADRLFRTLDRAALAGMAAGILLMTTTLLGDSFRLGFFVTAAATLLHIVTSHVAGGDA